METAAQSSGGPFRVFHVTLKNGMFPTKPLLSRLTEPYSGFLASPNNAEHAICCILEI